MRGLLEKDLRLILHRKQALLLFLVISVILGFTMDGGFIMGYVPFLMMTLGINTISYDELDNGLPFLFSLPVDRRTYVKSKFITSLSVTLVGWVAALIIYFAKHILIDNSYNIAVDLTTAWVFLPVSTLILSVMVPVLLKYGAEKSRIALAVVMGIIAAIFFIMIKINERNGIYIPQIIKQYSMLPLVLVIAGGIITVAAIGVSYAVSLKIMENKEF